MKDKRPRIIDVASLLTETVTKLNDVHEDVRETRINMKEMLHRVTELEKTTSFAKGIAALLVFALPIVLTVIYQIMGK